jgi:hypothetical protein
VHRRTAPAHPVGPGRRRAFRGLVLVFLLSFVNLIGAAVTVAALGGLGPWSRWQFIGLFGVIEAASGLANVITPNIWRLPIAELETTKRTDVKLAASVALLPHWGGLARFAAGVVCLGIAAWKTGLGSSSWALVPFILAVAWSVVGVSALLARAGVARPQIDVVQLTVRWRERESELAPFSIGASVLQFLLGIATVPVAKALSPSFLYRPELATSPPATVAVFVAAAALTVLVWVLWSGRIDYAAPREQELEAEKNA